jgi:hypothetical protein
VHIQEIIFHNHIPIFILHNYSAGYATNSPLVYLLYIHVTDLLHERMETMANAVYISSSYKIDR